MSTITPLEQTLITIAEGCLNYVQQYHAMRKLGSATAEDAETFEENHIALTTLVQLTHMRDTGLTDDALIELRNIEEKEAILLRSLAEAN